MKRLTMHSVAGIVAAAALLPAAEVAAEPYLAVRTGLKCASCHVNRSGGGGRSAFGNIWAQTQLPIKSLPVRQRGLNDWLSIGLDLRALGSWNVSRGEAVEDQPATAFEITDAQVQLEARLIDDRLAFYIDQTLGPQRAVAREAFGIVERLPLDGYAKIGKFMLPFGWRLWDDGEFIRSETGFTYLTPDIGMEVGIEPGPLSWFVSLSNGTAGASEGDSRKMVSSSASVTFRSFRIGASASHNSSSNVKTNIVGSFAGFTVGPVTVLGEVDAVFDSFSDTSEVKNDELLAFVEGNFLVHRGVNVKVTHGFHDPTAGIRDEAGSIPEDQRARTRVGLEVFPVNFVQVSAFYTRLDNAGEPADLDRLSLELHLHF
jgi:hypothetical protein